MGQRIRTRGGLDRLPMRQVVIDDHDVVWQKWPDYHLGIAWFTMGDPDPYPATALRLPARPLRDPR